MNKGKVVEIIGPVLDVAFEEGKMPPIYNAVEITTEVQGKKTTIVSEVAMHLGDNKVRCIAMSPTEGMCRGVEAIDTGKPISVPVGKETLGRVLNVLGEPVDEKGPIKAKQFSSIHRPAQGWKNRSVRWSRCG